MNKKLVITLLLAVMVTVTGCGNKVAQTNTAAVAQEENAQDKTETNEVAEAGTVAEKRY